MSLVPQPGSQPTPAAPEPRTRVAATNPAQTAPSAGAGTVGLMVQVSSQKSEADAQASFRSLQGKFPAILGSRESVIKRGETDKGVVYRAQIGPFASSDEAIQFCVSLKTAGGQCFVPRN